MLVALTGTTGFLGRQFASAGRAAGHAIRGLVVPGGPPARQGMESVTGDLADAKALKKLLAGADVLVHLAALGLAPQDRTWDRMALVNVVQPLALLEAAAEAKVRHVVLAGSSLEYTGHGRLPDAPAQGEPRCDESSPTDPSEPVGATKAAGGILERARARALGLPAWYLRFSQLYGPGDDPDKILPLAVRAAVARQPFDLSEGEEVREWLHVGDAVRALLAAVAAEPTEPVTIVNVGTGVGVRLVEVVRSAFEVAGANPELVRAGARPYRKNEMHRLVMDVSQAQRWLGGWRPRIDLLHGLEGIVQEAQMLAAPPRKR